MKVKIGTRVGEITPQYFSKFGKNFKKFAKALGIMFPQSTEEIAKDIWHQMGGVDIIEKPILEPSVKVLEQEAIVDTKEEREVVKKAFKNNLKVKRKDILNENTAYNRTINCYPERIRTN